MSVTLSPQQIDMSFKEKQGEFVQHPIIYNGLYIFPRLVSVRGERSEAEPLMEKISSFPISFIKLQTIMVKNNPKRGLFYEAGNYTQALYETLS